MRYAGGMQYLIRRATVKPELKGLWDGPAWKQAEVAELILSL